MDMTRVQQISRFQWQIEPKDKMRVPGIIIADEALMLDMDDKVYEQVTNVATLPGIVRASYAMPDAHWGYGFPIGGVAAFDADNGGVVSGGGVGFDISCGVGTLLTGLHFEQVKAVRQELANVLFEVIPAGVGSRGKISLNPTEMDEMLQGGAKWAVEQGYGFKDDLQRIEEQGCMAGADILQVSERARKRQRREMGTLGSGNHYLEVQVIEKIFDEQAAQAFGLREGEVVISTHCGSRGLGHQIGTEFLRQMAIEAPSHGLDLPDKELASAPINSQLGQQYLGAMRAGINCALANRQILRYLTRQIFWEFFPKSELKLLYDVSHNTCKEEKHTVDGKEMSLFVHRKGATRSFGPEHPSVRREFGAVGQPVLVGGTMGTASYILAGQPLELNPAFGSACHGAGRRMSRHQALKYWRGRDLIKSLAHKGIIVMSPSYRGVAEEAPRAYKDVDDVVNANHGADLARKVARLKPVICIKG